MKTMFRVFDRAVQTALFLCIAGFVVICFAQVICRVGLNNSIVWAEEACRYLFVWMVFLGAGIGLLHRRHITIDIVPNLIPKSARKYYNALIDLLILAFAAAIVYYGWLFAARGMRQVSTAMQIPLGYVYSGVVIGGIIMIINNLRIMLAELFAVPVEPEPEQQPEPEMTQEEFNRLLGIETAGKDADDDKETGHA